MTNQTTAEQKGRGTSPLARHALFAGVALVWLIFDVATKLHFENAYALGETSAQAYGLFQFRLVHNTGAAWGMFGDSTFMLGITSSLVCAVIVVLYALFDRVAGHAPTMLETAALALVFSGGVGNAIDRFSQGFVVDFIDLTFMDFPVFNIADIGVTCGFALLIIGYLVATRAQGKPGFMEEGAEDAASSGRNGDIENPEEGNSFAGASDSGRGHSMLKQSWGRTDSPQGCPAPAELRVERPLPESGVDSSEPLDGSADEKKEV